MVAQLAKKLPPFIVLEDHYHIHRRQPSPESHVTFRNMLSVFKVRSSWALDQPPNWRTTSCWLSLTAYSLYSQQLFMFQKVRHAMATRGTFKETFLLFRTNINVLDDLMSRDVTKRVGIVLRLWTRIRDVFGSNLGQDTDSPERGF
jgi:hypothetical protein